MKFFLKILLSALGIMAAAAIVPGIQIANFWVAILVALILGALNVTVGLALKVLTWPLSLVTFGVFILVINAWVFWTASFVKGFYVSGFVPAFWGALVVTIVSMIGKRLLD